MYIHVHINYNKKDDYLLVFRYDPSKSPSYEKPLKAMKFPGTSPFTDFDLTSGSFQVLNSYYVFTKHVPDMTSDFHYKDATGAVT